MGIKLLPNGVKIRYGSSNTFLGIDRFTAGFIAEFDYKDAGKVDFWDPKSLKNRSQNYVGQGRRPGIEFGVILMDFGSQNGVQNLLKSYL